MFTVEFLVFFSNFFMLKSYRTVNLLSLWAVYLCCEKCMSCFLVFISFQVWLFFVSDYCQKEVVQLDIFEIGRRWLIVPWNQSYDGCWFIFKCNVLCQNTTLKAAFENSQSVMFGKLISAYTSLNISTGTAWKVS